MHLCLEHSGCQRAFQRNHHPKQAVGESKPVLREQALELVQGLMHRARSNSILNLLGGHSCRINSFDRLVPAFAGFVPNADRTTADLAYLI